MKNGGPAFPINQRTEWMGDPSGEFPAQKVSIPAHGGMSLRDYFAAKAMQSLARSIDANDIGAMAEGVLGGSRISKAAYVFADAVLAEREKHANL